jgi:hypothetical protein
MDLNRAARLVAAATLIIGLAGVPVLAEDAAPAASTAAATSAGDPTQSPAVELAGANAPDLKRGKIVYQTTANCVNCHGWPGDGSTGKNPRSPGIAANLRKSKLDMDTMIQVVSCGIPGSAMPYHDRQAYKDARCYGTTAKDYTPDQIVSGNVITNQDIINVVAYVQEKIKGHGDITKAECEEYFKPGAATCSIYK